MEYRFILALILFAVPFSDAEKICRHFGETFRAPGGATLEIPGCYDGSDEWVIRFSAPAGRGPTCFL